MNEQKVVTPDHMQKLYKDIKKAAVTLSTTEVRFLVDSYYIMQEDRKRAHNQERALGKSEEPHEIITWLKNNSKLMEDELKTVLDLYSDSQPIGKWMRSNYGIGPVISAALLAHIDIKKAPTVGHIWRFAGLDPTSKWEKKTKRPWNAALKVVCWKIGDSFKKFHNSEECVYGKLYEKRKAYEIARNDSGGNAETAARILTEKNFDKTTETYKHLISGHLPPAQIDGRAMRWTTKIFLSHLHCVWWWYDTKTPPPNPFVIQHMGHVHITKPQNLHMFPGLEEALSHAP